MSEKEMPSRKFQDATLMLPIKLYDGPKLDYHNDTFFIFIKKEGRLYPINIHKDLKEEIIPYSLYELRYCEPS